MQSYLWFVHLHYSVYSLQLLLIQLPKRSFVWTEMGVNIQYQKIQLQLNHSDFDLDEKFVHFAFKLLKRIWMYMYMNLFHFIVVGVRFMVS